MNRVLVFLVMFCLALNVSAQKKKSSATTQKSSSSQKSSAKTTTQQKSTKKPKVETKPLAVPVFSVQELERQRKETQKEIELTSVLLKETSSNARNSLNRLNLLSQQLLARKKMIAILEQELSALESKINALTADIEILDKDLQKTKDNYAKSMQNQQQEMHSAQYKMLVILSAENLSQSYRRMRYLREYSDWQKDEALRIISKQEEIVRRKTQLEKSREEKQTLLDQREKESKQLANEEAQQQREVNELNKKQKDLQNQLAQKRSDAEALDKQIDRLIAEEISASEKQAAPPTSSPTATKTETPKTTAEPSTAKPTASTETKPAAPSSGAGTYQMSETELNLAKDFASNKGKLPYPLSGQYTVVAHFGEHQHSELSYVRTNNNGIDIQGMVGAEALAVFKGVVTRIFTIQGYNNNVIIRHGNYISVYSNLSQVYVKAGDVVSTRQPIGKIFSDFAKGNETVLHFQIWKERTKQNPEVWIK